MKNWLLADVETTGLGASDRVVEVAWMQINDAFEIIASGHSLIDPDCPIPPGASAVHGIANRDVVGAPDLDSYMATVDLQGPLVFVAHNAKFDAQFLGKYLPQGFEQLCTVRLARKLWPNVDNHKLGTLVYALELEVEKDRFHSADGDMAVLRALLMKAHEEFGLSLDDMLDLERMPVAITAMPFGKHKGQSLDTLPKSYVKWLLGLENLDSDLRVALQAL